MATLRDEDEEAQLEEEALATYRDWLLSPIAKRLPRAGRIRRDLDREQSWREHLAQLDLEQIHREREQEREWAAFDLERRRAHIARARRRRQELKTVTAPQDLSTMSARSSRLEVAGNTVRMARPRTYSARNREEVTAISSDSKKEEEQHQRHRRKRRRKGRKTRPKKDGSESSSSQSSSPQRAD